MCYNEQKSKLRPYTNPSNKIERQLFGILNFGPCDLFGICVLLFEIFYYRNLNTDTLRSLQHVVIKNLIKA